jgi:hypothetical protein
MRIDTYFTVPEVDVASIGEATVVVIDVIRATTTIIEALANGAREIYPTESTEEGVKLASSLRRRSMRTYAPLLAAASVAFHVRMMWPMVLRTVVMFVGVPGGPCGLGSAGGGTLAST